MDTWQPVAEAERYDALDVLRGVALFGVLMVNLLTLFRVSLFEHILTFHTHPGWANHLVDVLVAGLLEFKAFTLFSFMFGVGVAIQAERAMSHAVDYSRFLTRRFLVLLLLGLCHLLLIWNGDILALYAVCGLLVVPLLRLSSRALLVLGVAAIVLPYFVPLGISLPSEETLRAHIVLATRIYSRSGFLQILAFRWHETWSFVMPLLMAFLPKTAGLMLCGVVAWRSGVVCEPRQHQSLLRAFLFGAGLIGGTLTALQLTSDSSGLRSSVPSVVLDLGSSTPLAFAYAAGLFLWLNPARAAALPSLAAAGRMTLTNYLLQSVVLGFIFYGYGLGLFGRLGPAAAASIGIALYAAQLGLSRMWLQRFRFGPFEWLWRSMAYGRRQRMRRESSCEVSMPRSDARLGDR